jgi:hypothetical protein
MSQGSVSDDVILNSIRVLGARFDASPKAIAALKDAGVSDAVIDALQKASDESTDEPVAPR